MPKSRVKKRPDGRYAAQIFLGRDEEGRRMYKTVYGATPKEVEDSRQKVKEQLGRGLDLSASDNTFGYWAKRWEATKKREVKAGTWGMYASARSHLSRLDDTPIDRVRMSDIQEILHSLADQNPNTKKPASEKMLKTVKCTAEQIIQLAIDNRALDYNAAKSTKATVVGAAHKKERRALTEVEQGWIRDTPHRAQTAAMIMMYAGLRRGELIPLTWSDIDLKQKKISVNKSVEMINGRPVVKPGGKSKSATREVYMPDVLVCYLKRIKRSSILICPDTDGGMMSSSAWRSMWNSYLADLNMAHGDFSNCICGKNGKIRKSKFDPKSKHNPNGVPLVIPRITAHWLRHTFATMLYLSGVDIMTARDQLGHADIAITMEIYTHLDTVYKKRSMAKLNDYLSKQA